jgi:CcmD family protein
MDSLVAAYLIAWMAVASYVTWLGMQNWRLARRLDEIESQESHRIEHHTSAKAA